jgi:Ser/Thr protein kinase RdoA (MazF antagonist)
MTQGERTDERPSAALAALVRDRFDVSVEGSGDAWRGEESIGWRATSPDGDRFVQLFPASRSVEALTWCDRVAEAASSRAPASVHAIVTHDGFRVVESLEGPVMVFPFVDAVHPGDRPLDVPAAELLAAVHRGIEARWDRRSGPRPDRGARWAHTRSDLMVDHDLDRWEATVASRGADLPIHGDFYGGNLFVRGDRIVGVVDWSDADLMPMEQEVSWAVWEFCQDAGGEDLVDERAEAFLRAYVAADGPANVAPPFDPLPWVRRRLRAEARGWFSDPRSATEPDVYHAAQLVAFERLRDRHLAGR